MSYMTLSELKSYLNITDNTQDTQLNLFNNVSAQLINSYIGKTMDNRSLVEFATIQPDQSRYYVNSNPIIKVDKVQIVEEVINITSTQDVSLLVQEDTLTVNSNVYTLSSYANVNALFDQVQLDYSYITHEITDNIVAIDLIPTTIDIQANSTVTLFGYNQIKDSNYTYNKQWINLYSGHYKISYTAGYTTIPEDLKYVNSRIVQDMINIQSGKVDPNISSESITNYSYSRSNIDMRSIVNNYDYILDNYRPSVIIGSSDIPSFYGEGSNGYNWGN